MLDDLRGEQAAERLIGQRAQVAERVAFDGLEALRAADLDHLVIEIETARRRCRARAAGSGTRRGRSRCRGRRVAPSKIGRYASSRLRISSREPRKRSSNPTYFHASEAAVRGAAGARSRAAPAPTRLPERRRPARSAGAVPIRSTSRFSAIVAWCSTAIASRNSRLDSACAAPIAVTLASKRFSRATIDSQRLRISSVRPATAPSRRDVAVADVAGELEVLGVDEAGELLEVDDQRRVERAQLAERVGGEAQRRLDRLAGGAIDGDAAVDVIDQRRVEGLLALEDRRDHAPRRGRASLRCSQLPAIGGASGTIRQRSLSGVICVSSGGGGGCGASRTASSAASTRGERLVVARVGLGARLRQHADGVVGRQRRREDARDLVGHRPMTPVSGLLAVA